MEFAGGAQHVRGRPRAIVAGARAAVPAAIHIGLSHKFVAGLNRRVNFGWRCFRRCGFAVVEGGRFSRDIAVFVAGGAGAGGDPQKRAQKREEKGCFIHPF